jgi:hypothetical protein
VGRLSLARPPVELAEAEMAMRDEGSHSERFGERQRSAVMPLAARGIEPVAMARDVAEQMQRVGHESVLAPRLAQAPAQALRLVEPAEPATGATEEVVNLTRLPTTLHPGERSKICSPSRTRFSASLASPSSASAQAEAAIALLCANDRESPVRTTVTECSSSERAFTQSPLRR